MAMTKKIITKTVVLFVLLILMAAIVITINSSSKNPEFRDDSSLISNNGRSTTQELLVNTKPISDIYSDEMQVFMLNMVNKLREMHGHNIQEVKVQLSLLDFKVFILETYPDNGVALFESIILQAFPLYGDKILGLIASMSEYNKWLKENQLALSE
jgi:hypothetical protein